ncbi:MAG: SDR family NAD(P)-dependent oxidoreductase [Bacteroidia bacterium]|nr:SDR family NAD(P)-dependent oxidoreductase [Bacteroidia bacterium]
MDITKTNIVVTGAASGIGLAILEELLKFDCKIIAADRNAENLEKVAITHIDKVTPFVGDLSNPDQVDQLFDFAKTSLGSVDLFIANAGFAYYEQLKGADWSHLELIFRLNTLSPIYSLLKMQQLNSHKKWKTVMVSSAMAEWSVPGYTVYGATKAAIHRFAEGYRFDNSGNHLMVVFPIATRTKFFETAGNRIPMAFPIQSAESVAKKIIKGIRHDRRKVYPSGLFRFILIINRILPFIKPVYQAIEFRKLKRWLKK